MTQEWQAVAWALAAQDLDLAVEELDLEAVERSHGHKARAWLVARDAAHEWQVRQPTAVSEPIVPDWQAQHVVHMENELDLARKNLHRVTDELRKTKQLLASARATERDVLRRALESTLSALQEALNPEAVTR